MSEIDSALYTGLCPSVRVLSNAETRWQEISLTMDVLMIRFSSQSFQ